MNPIRTKIEIRLDILEKALKSENHLHDGADFIEVLKLINSISKFWPILEDGQRDFINASRHAVKHQKKWT